MSHPFNVMLLTLVAAALIVNQYWLALAFAYGALGYCLGRTRRPS